MKAGTLAGRGIDFRRGAKGYRVERPYHNDTGSAGRFFYSAKASASERNEGVPDGERSTHPTVKPIALMRYLIRLVTPPGGLVLDPFLGSGTTAIAAHAEGMRCVGIEQDASYMAIARQRVREATRQQELFTP